MLFSVYCAFCVSSQALQVHSSLLVFSIHCGVLCSFPGSTTTLESTCVQYLLCPLCSFPDTATTLQCNSVTIYRVLGVLCQALPLYWNLLVFSIYPAFCVLSHALPLHSSLLCSVVTVPCEFLPRNCHYKTFTMKWTSYKENYTMSNYICIYNHVCYTQGLI
jgi:hypothetical protein